MSEAIKPTPGEWAFRDDDGWRLYIDGISVMGNAQYYPWVPDNKADWMLFADAGNTYNATGLTPCQLVERVKDLEEALTRAQQAINSMKVEAETAAQGDEQMMLEACETISNEGLDADMEIRDVLDKALPNAAAKEAGK